MKKPTVKPARPYFSSGPCVKIPGWSVDTLKDALIHRSHRATAGIERIRDVTEKTRQILGIPDTYDIAIIMGGDTGAMEAAMWNLLGARTVDVLSWDVFGDMWVYDIADQLKISHRLLRAPYGHLPSLDDINWDHDVVFTWNGTTAGAKVPDAPWINPNRKGLTICDAVSHAFAGPLPWDHLDVTTFSWQKGLGAEGGHGMLVLSPRAMERLRHYTPVWPIPRLLRLKIHDVIVEGAFKGLTINTPSMLCVEDCLTSLNWITSIGGADALYARCDQNAACAEAWVKANPWIDYFVENPLHRSKTSIILAIVAPWFLELHEDDARLFIGRMGALIAEEEAGFEIINHKDAPPTFRIWCGPTVEVRDIKALLPWLTWAYEKLSSEHHAGLY